MDAHGRTPELDRLDSGHFKEVDGIIHLGGQSAEAPWEAILEANIVGCYNLFEAARKTGARRIVFATSNHAVGFYPRTTTIGTDVIPRPDSRYGVSKLFGEGLGAMYAYKHGIGVTSLRIGNVAEKPVDARRLAIWIRPEDLVAAKGLRATVQVMERLGGVSITYGVLPGGTRICAALPGDTPVREGDTIDLGVPVDAAHAFDQSGAVLRRRNAPQIAG